MKRDTRLYIDDILYAIKNIEKYLKGLSFEDFSKDSKTVDAVVRNFEIIGKPQNKFLSKPNKNTSKFRGE